MRLPRDFSPGRRLFTLLCLLLIAVTWKGLQHGLLEVLSINENDVKPLTMEVTFSPASRSDNVSIPGPTTSAGCKMPINDFRCLRNGDEELWGKRRRWIEAQTRRDCHEPIARSFVQTFKKPVPIVFVAWKATAKVQILVTSANTAAKFNNEVHIIFVDSPPISGDNAYSLAPNVHSHHVSSGSKHDPLAASWNYFEAPLYHHLSVNPYEYELSCFKRWFVVDKLMETENLTHVFVLDADVLLLTNVTVEAQTCYSGCKSFGVSFGVYNSFWPRDLLQTFLSYMVDYYQKQTYKTRHSFHNGNPIVSDMFLYEYFLQDFVALYPEQRACLVTTVDSDNAISPRGIFDIGAFSRHLEYFHQDDELDLPYYCGISNVKHCRLKSLHFQGVAKDLYLAKCLPPM